MSRGRNKVDFNTQWPEVKKSIEEIMDNLNVGVTNEKWMKTYTNVYDLCTKQTNRDTSRRRSPRQQGVQVSGGLVYEKLRELLQEKVRAFYAGCSDLIEEPLLKFLSQEWTNFTTAGKFIKFLFSYLDRHYVPRQTGGGKTDVYLIYDLHLVIFHDELYKKLKTKLVSAVINFIAKERIGEHIDRSLMKKIVDIFVALGQTRGKGEASLVIYRQDFETVFLQDTDKFYQQESARFISENNVSEYMMKAEARIDEEVARVNAYLHASSEDRLLDKCVDVLVKQRIKLLWKEFEELVQIDKLDDLQRMYKLLNRVPDGLKVLRDNLEQIIKDKGLDALEAVKDQAIKDPRIYVDTMLGTYQRYHRLVQKAFRGDPGFVTSLDKACKKFMNDNAVCRAGNSPSQSPELVAKFCDMLLKKSSKNPDETELSKTLNDVMIVFKYLEDKDVFQKFYSKNLAKRLIHGSSVSEDAESEMIGKLKAACGYEWSSKLQRMYQDVTVSREMNTNFKNFIKSKNYTLDVDFSVMVLATGFWPLSPPQTKFAIPGQLEGCVNHFTNYYNNTHNGRKLNWLHQLSRGEVKVKLRGKVYIFLVSTYQMAILLLFNTNEKIKFEEFQEHVQLNPPHLQGVLTTLIKKKVVIADPEKTNDHGTTYSLNAKYKNAKSRVQLNVPIKVEQHTDNEATHRQIEEERKMLIQAAIVQSYEITRFKPNVKIIKKCIDLLIEKEYLERTQGQKDQYNYLA
ncbi:cullin-1 [Anaeramoeba ignava]|uniref:Cullin-1 n=1 Tax=Anaeramoeba ignava TaxID=1746090 RepID=A0A9Q0LSC3_ANAIG|nr:cullin-1 [Anaeramoeba ignava]